MPQQKYILDTNAYLRLAQSLHPLLGVEFGNDQHTPYIVHEINTEITYSPRLETVFSWVKQPKYAENRTKQISISKIERNKVKLTIEHLKVYAYEEKLGVSDVDTKAVAYCYVLNLPLITDDQDMASLGRIFSVKILKTMEYLFLMLSYKHIDIEVVKTITSYWYYIKDLPKDFKKDLDQLFGLSTNDLDVID